MAQKKALLRLLFISNWDVDILTTRNSRVAQEVRDLLANEKPGVSRYTWGADGSVPVDVVSLKHRLVDGK